MLTLAAWHWHPYNLIVAQMLSLGYLQQQQTRPDIVLQCGSEMYAHEIHIVLIFKAQTSLTDFLKQLLKVIK